MKLTGSTKHLSKFTVATVLQATPAEVIAPPVSSGGGGGGGGGGPAPTPTPQAGGAASKVIDPAAGGSLTNQIVTALVPPGAVVGPASLTVSISPVALAAGAPATVPVVQASQPEGSSFGSTAFDLTLKDPQGGLVLT